MGFGISTSIFKFDFIVGISNNEISVGIPSFSFWFNFPLFNSFQGVKSINGISRDLHEIFGFLKQKGTMHKYFFFKFYVILWKFLRLT